MQVSDLYTTNSYFCYQKYCDMSFLVPAFLWSLFAISIPVIIHLFHFRRFKTVYFSNNALLQNLQKENRTKTKLKHYLILLMRILTIAALVFAFAQPFVPASDHTNTATQKNIVIYIDNSFSMDAEGEQGRLIDRARQIAYDIVSSYQADMQYYLITNDFQPRHQQLMNAHDIKRELADVQNVPVFRSIGEVLLKAQSLAGNNQSLNIYIISDLQKTAFESETAIDKFGHSVFLIPVQNISANNISIDSCWFANPVKTFGKTEELTVKITNHSNLAYTGIPLQLIINDTVKAITEINIEALETKNIEIDFTHSSRGIVTGQISIDDYPVIFDNTLYFSFSINQVVNILSINEAFGQQYLSALYATDSKTMQYSDVKAGNEKNSEFHRYELIVANGLKSISSGLASAFVDYVKSGHVLMIIPGKEIDIQSYNQLLSYCELGVMGEGAQASRKLASVNYQHYLFRDVFGKIDQNIDLPEFSWFSPVQLFNTSGADIAISDNKGNPVFVSKRMGAGRVLLCNLPLIPENEAFMKHPVFVPLFFNAALFSGDSHQTYHIIGEKSTVDVKTDETAYTVFHFSDSTIDVIPQYRIIQGGARISIPEYIVRAGHYVISSDSKPLSMVSMNYSRKESSTDYLQTEQAIEILQKMGVEQLSPLQPTDTSFSMNIIEQSLGKMLWKWFVIAALVFIIAEILIARFMK